MQLAVVSAHQKVTLTEARQFLDSLLRHLGLKAELSATEHTSFIPGRAGKVSVLGIAIGTIGEINPEVLDSFGIEQPVAAFEINLTELFPLVGKAQTKSR